jgi:hypothetical protein
VDARGRRITILPGTRVGAIRVLSKRFSAPVLVSTRPGRKVVLDARLRNPSHAKAALRIVLRRPDGSLAEEAVS